MRNRRRKNNIIIGGLLAIVLAMGIGYAAFSSKLSINGTGSVSSNFDVKITGITSKSVVGTAGNKTNPTYTDTTATFYTTLQSPSDSITYDITVANNGTLDATLDSITTTNGNNNAITFTTSGLSKGDILLKGEVKTLTVKVTYNSSVTSQPSNTTSNLKVVLNFVQKGVDSNGIAFFTASDQILKKENVITSGDGLYKDSVTNGRYYYRGGNVNNYITFNGETWRIISLERDGTLKIIRNEQLSNTYQWDAAENRNSETSTYCTKASASGCNAWAATKNLIGNPSEFIQYFPRGNVNDNTKYFGTVASDASLNTYLNGTYYNSISNTDRQKIAKGTFNVSTPGYFQDTESLEIDAQEEAQYQWNGFIALYTVSELLRASTDLNCTNLNVGYSNGKVSPCKNSNWLWPTSKDYEWTLSPDGYTTRDYIYRVYFDGFVYDGSRGFDRLAIRPVLHLSSNITINGAGTLSDPYRVVS